jgi:hypothetical protein
MRDETDVGLQSADTIKLSFIFVLQSLEATAVPKIEPGRTGTSHQIWLTLKGNVSAAVTSAAADALVANFEIEGDHSRRNVGAMSERLISPSASPFGGDH